MMKSLSEGPGTSGFYVFERRQLFKLMRDSGFSTITDQMHFLKKSLAEKCTVGVDFQRFTSRLKKKWVESNRCLKSFEKKNEKWLKETISLRAIHWPSSTFSVARNIEINDSALAQLNANKTADEDKSLCGVFIKEEFIDDVTFDDELEEVDHQKGLLGEFRDPSFNVNDDRNDEGTISAGSPVCNSAVEGVEVTEEDPEFENECAAPDSQNSSKGEPKIGGHSGRLFPARVFYGCNLCDYTCLQETDLKKHKVVHIGKEPFSCGQCDYHCREEYELEIHKAMHITQKLLACGVCDYIGRNEHNLKDHQMTQNRKELHACDNCDCRSSIVFQEDGFQQHQDTLSREDLFACDICKHSSQTEKDLEVNKENT